MPSQVINSSSTDLQVLDIFLFVCEYHISIGHGLYIVVAKMLSLRREPANTIEKQTVAVFKTSAVVSHVLYNILRRSTNKVFCQVTGEIANSKKAGYGLEVQCTLSMGLKAS